MSISVFSCYVGAQAMWKPNKLFRQNVCEIPGGIFSQWWVSKRWQNDRKYLPGEVWIGLDKLHQLTSVRSYSLKITMTDYDGEQYTALFEQFQVNSFSFLFAGFLSIVFAKDKPMALISSHRLAKGMVMSWQWKGSTMPVQPLETTWEFTMGWSSAPGKSNFDTIKKFRMKLTPCACPGTGTRMHGAAGTVLRSTPVDGGIMAATMPTPPVWAVPPRRMMIPNMLLIIGEEREGTAMTVGPRQSTYLSQTESVQCCQTLITLFLAFVMKRSWCQLCSGNTLISCPGQLNNGWPCHWLSQWVDLWIQSHQSTAVYSIAAPLFVWNWLSWQTVSYDKIQIAILRWVALSTLQSCHRDIWPCWQRLIEMIFLQNKLVSALHVEWLEQPWDVQRWW